MKTFLFCSANLTDCFFAAESEEIVSSLQKVKMFFFCRLVSSLCKVKMFFFCRLVSSLCKVKTFFCSAKLTDYFFSLQSEQKVNMFFFRSENLTDYFFSLQSEQKVNMFFFRSVKLTDYFFSLHSEQKVNRKMLLVWEQNLTINLMHLIHIMYRQ